MTILFLNHLSCVHFGRHVYMKVNNSSNKYWVTTLVQAILLSKVRRFHCVVISILFQHRFLSFLYRQLMMATLLRLLCITVVLMMYFPVSTAGFYTYGHVQDNILDSVTSGPAHTVVSVLIIAHLMLGFVIVINPFCQEIEHLCRVPTGDNYTSWQFNRNNSAISVLPLKWPRCSDCLTDK